MQPKIVMKVGSAVKIQTVLDRANPDSVTIEIEDPSETVKVNYLAMSAETDKIYYYIWQSASTDDDGDYKVTIVATYGSYISKEQSWFTMEDID